MKALRYNNKNYFYFERNATYRDIFNWVGRNLEDLRDAQLISETHDCSVYLDKNQITITNDNDYIELEITTIIPITL